jgi:cobalt/nickel transport system permease protein
MHISEGVLAAPVLITGAAGAAIGCGIGLKKMDLDKTPKVAVLASAFFVASLIHVPVGPTSIHLMLNGLIGIILGWASFPALVVALFLQTILFQFGGITTLGVNTVNMALPAVICFLLFSRLIKGRNNSLALIAGFAAGVISILLAGILVAFSLIFTGEQFHAVAKLFVIAHSPVMLIEGILTAFIVGFLRKVKPEILGGIG